MERGNVSREEFLKWGGGLEGSIGVENRGKA